MSLTKKLCLTTCVLLTASLVACWEVGRGKFPYGGRTCFLPCMLGSLVTYAGEHDGNFPDGTNAYAAIQKLYPKFITDPADMLAGISGDIRQVNERLKACQTISSNECSWIYFPGLRHDDNPKLILLFERVSGVAGNGRKYPGHAVGFVDGQLSQIPDTNWEELLAEQARLRAGTMAKRAATTNR